AARWRHQRPEPGGAARRRPRLDGDRARRPRLGVADRVARAVHDAHAGPARRRPNRRARRRPRTDLGFASRTAALAHRVAAAGRRARLLDRVPTARGALAMSTATLWRHARLATLAGAAPWGEVVDGALLVEGDRLRWVGRDGQWPGDLQIDAEHDLGGALVTPGLIDCHTHLVYGGQRAREFELRLQGASYEDIARAGGGIRSTVVATRAASDDSLFASAHERALALMADGVTA